MDEQEYLKQQKKEAARQRKEMLASERGNTFSFRLEGSWPEEAMAVEQLNEALQGVGVSFEISDSDFSGYDLHYLRVTIRENNVRNLKTRNAGREQHVACFEEDGRTQTATLNKVTDLIDRFGAVEAAKMLGMSKSGMYKRLGKARELHLPCRASEEPMGEDDLQF